MLSSARKSVAVDFEDKREYDEEDVENALAKDELKAAGFKFAGKKKAWYWHSGDYKKRSRKKLSMNEIRSLYGSQKIETEEEDKRKQLTA